MMIRMLGAALTLLSGMIFAVNVTKEHREKEDCFEELLMILEHFVWELQTNQPPLAICCQIASQCGMGQRGKLFSALAQYLAPGGEASPSECMERALQEHPIPSAVRERLTQLADTLGRYDLCAQISGIQAVQELCRRDQQALALERSKTVKSCQALGICTGAAVAILLL